MRVCGSSSEPSRAAAEPAPRLAAGFQLNSRTGLPPRELRSQDTCYWAHWGWNTEVSALLAGAENRSPLWIFFFWQRESTVLRNHQEPDASGPDSILTSAPKGAFRSLFGSGEGNNALSPRPRFEVLRLQLRDLLYPLELLSCLQLAS